MASTKEMREDAFHKLFRGIMGNDCETVKKAISEGAPLEEHYGCSQDHQSPLYWAFGQNIEIVKLLLNFGADINNYSCEYGNELPGFVKDNPQILQLIDEAKKKSPLHRAASSGNIYTIKYILSGEYNSYTPKYAIDERDDHLNTPLHEAAAFDQIEVIELLVAKGADINATDMNGDTPLHKAVAYGSTKSIKLLLKLGAKRSIRNKKGYKAY